MSFSFIIYKEFDYEIGKLVYDNKSIMIWYIHKEKQTDDLFSLYDFELFINKIKNDIDCSFYRNNKTIFEYRNNIFYIHPIKNGLNIILNEQNKIDLLNVLQEIYNWRQSILIEEALTKFNL